MAKKVPDPMDGAFYPAHPNEKPEHFMTQEDGMRPHNSTKPSGKIHIDLTDGIQNAVLPPRFIWRKGEWAETKGGDDWDKWVVSGEGTPGNFEYRLYRIPQGEREKPVPRHPADWVKSLKEPAKKSSSSSYSGGSGGYSSGKSWLPYGLRFRCVGCGHFFKQDDLATHVKSACPATQDQPALWVIQCECHPNNLLMSAEVLPGFPVKPPEEKKDDETAPDTSGAKKGEKDAETASKTG